MVGLSRFPKRGEFVINTPAADVQPDIQPDVLPDILIVEDDEMVQAFLALHLENEGYGVRSALNGAEMIGALSDGTPDFSVEPTVAFAILVEFGGSGGQTNGPLAKRVSDALFETFGPGLRAASGDAEVSQR